MKVTYPYLEANQLRYIVQTVATSGNIATQHFGQEFDAAKVDGQIKVIINIYVPESVNGDENTTLLFNLEKNTIKELSDDDFMYTQISRYRVLDADLTHWSYNITAPNTKPNRYTGGYYEIALQREVSNEDIRSMDMKMPGFKLTWFYNTKVDKKDSYLNITYFMKYLYPYNVEFTRLIFENIYLGK